MRIILYKNMGIGNVLEFQIVGYLFIILEVDFCCSDISKWHNTIAREKVVRKGSYLVIGQNEENLDMIHKDQSQHPNVQLHGSCC